MRVTCKTQFFQMWEAGVLGNRTRLWRNPDEAYLWGVHESYRRDLGPGLPEIGFREIGKSGGGAWEKVGWLDVPETARKWTEAGRNFICDDGAPDEGRTLQGEVCRTYRGLEGFLDTVGKLPMRPAMAAGHMRVCRGATVLALLDRFMDPSSRDDLDGLLELFPDATVEFSCFSVDVGIIPNRNTLFWETRNY